MYICIYVHKRIYTSYIYIYRDKNTHTQTQTRTNTNTHTDMHVHKHTHTRKQTHTHTCTNTHTHTHTQTNTHTHTRTHTHSIFHMRLCAHTLFLSPPLSFPLPLPFMPVRAVSIFLAPLFLPHATGRRRPIGCLIFEVIFRKRAL